LSCLNDELQFFSLIFDGDLVADDRRSEAALWAEPKSLHRKIAPGFGNALRKNFQRFKLRLFGRDQSENDKFVLRHVPKRRKRARARIVVFQQQPLCVQFAK